MIIKKFKIFESTEDSVRDLEDIFLDIDLEFECDVYVFYINPTPSDRIGYYSICLEQFVTVLIFSLIVDLLFLNQLVENLSKS